MKTSRRGLLKGLGAFGALPFMPALEASAAGQGGPLRFFGIYYPHGASSPLYGLRTSSWRAPSVHSPATSIRMTISSQFAGMSWAAAARAAAATKVESEPTPTKPNPSAT